MGSAYHLMDDLSEDVFADKAIAG